MRPVKRRLNAAFYVPTSCELDLLVDWRHPETRWVVSRAMRQAAQMRPPPTAVVAAIEKQLQDGAEIWL